MAISETIERKSVGELFFDPHNPRLGRRLTGKSPSQEEILGWMTSEGVLEELAVSFVESGFWTQEALVVVEEKLGKKKELVVVEGNRRLAALIMLFKAKAGDDVSSKWKELARSVTSSQKKKLQEIPFVRADKRKDVQAYLGFRHVSGIKEWNPAEKAEFIAHLVDDENLSYEQVMRRIGSKTEPVRRNYISYRILLQMEKQGDRVSIKRVENRFSVLFLSLRTEGVQQYLDIDILADPSSAKSPVPRDKLKQLVNFSCWLFGTDEKTPVVRDSRQTEAFGKILESKKAVDYLGRTAKPVFETAYRIAGGDEVETYRHLERAGDEVEEALGTVHLFKSSKQTIAAVERLAKHVIQLLKVFPKIKADVWSNEE